MTTCGRRAEVERPATKSQISHKSAEKESIRRGTKQHYLVEYWICGGEFVLGPFGRGRSSDFRLWREFNDRMADSRVVAARYDNVSCVHKEQLNRLHGGR